MAKSISRFEMDAEQLIQLKKLHLDDLRSKYYDLLNRESDLKNAENELILNTDFKSLGLTNEKMRNAYVSKALSSLRFELDQSKYKYKQEEDIIEILNDLIKLRLQEVKTE